jgi:hypothetical protein
VSSSIAVPIDPAATTAAMPATVAKWRGRKPGVLAG